MEKLYYTIGEAASLLGENASLVRFWTTRFEKFLKPRRNAKGNRLYTRDDLEVLKQLHLLVKENGMTLDGAEKRLAAERRPVEDRVKALNALTAIREQLLEIRSAL